MKRFKIGDSVWAMRADRPTERKVFGVIETSNINESATLLFYQLTNLLGVTHGTKREVKSYGDLPGSRYEARHVHATKKELLDSFL